MKTSANQRRDEILEMNLKAKGQFALSLSQQTTQQQGNFSRLRCCFDGLLLQLEKKNLLREIKIFSYEFIKPAELFDFATAASTANGVETVEAVSSFRVACESTLL